MWCQKRCNGFILHNYLSGDIFDLVHSLHFLLKNTPRYFTLSLLSSGVSKHLTSFLTSFLRCALFSKRINNLSEYWNAVSSVVVVVVVVVVVAISLDFWTLILYKFLMLITSARGKIIRTTIGQFLRRNKIAA